MPEAISPVIVTAVITALISLLGLIIAKEHKVSEFRQAWIDSLRDDISRLLAHSEAIVHVLRTRSQGEDWTDGERDVIQSSELIDKIRSDLVAAEECYFRILLRVNATEDASRLFLETLDKMRESLNDEQIPSPDALHEMEMKLVQSSRRLLKQEWERVKKGEVTFKIAKAASLLGVVIFGVLLGAWFLIGLL